MQIDGAWDVGSVILLFPRMGCNSSPLRIYWVSLMTILRTPSRRTDFMLRQYCSRTWANILMTKGLAGASFQVIKQVPVYHVLRPHHHHHHLCGRRSCTHNFWIDGAEAFKFKCRDWYHKAYGQPISIRKNGLKGCLLMMYSIFNNFYFLCPSTEPSILNDIQNITSTKIESLVVGHVSLASARAGWFLSHAGWNGYRLPLIQSIPQYNEHDSQLNGG